MSVDTLAASSPFLIEEAVEFKEARSYVESIRNPYLRDYANRYLWHLLSFAKKPSDRGLPETEARQVERKIAEFIPRTIPQYSTTVNPFKKKEIKPKAKYVLMKGTGSIVSVESWEREKASMIARGERPPEVEYIEEKPDKYEPATVEGEPVPEKYRELTPLIDLPLPPGADFLAAVIPEERKIDVVMRQLKDGVESIQDSAQFRLFLTTMAKFHDYSIGNQILIMLQKPAATRVAGFVTWKDLGRWVKKGESGIAILAPVMPPKPKKEEREEEEEIVPSPVYFKVVHVFDIAQTEGKPLPEFDVPVLTGEANEELFSRVMALAKAQGLEVSFESRPHMDLSIKGMYSAPKSIWVRPEESKAQQLKSLLHEVAHYYSEGVFRMPRRDAETIAESSAFAVGAHYGFDSGVRSFPYVALWAQDKKILTQNLNTIRNVADTMLHALEGTPKQSMVYSTKLQFIKVGERVRYIGTSKYRYNEWPTGAWLQFGVEGTVSEYHPELLAPPIPGEDTIPAYAVVSWDIGGKTAIDAEYEGKNWERIGSRTKYLEKKQPSVEYLPDTPEYLAETIDAAGSREKLDDAFQEAIARVRKQDGDSR